MIWKHNRSHSSQAMWRFLNVAKASAESLFVVRPWKKDKSPSNARVVSPPRHREHRLGFTSGRCDWMKNGAEPSGPRTPSSSLSCVSELARCSRKVARGCETTKNHDSPSETCPAWEPPSTSIQLVWVEYNAVYETHSWRLLPHMMHWKKNSGTKVKCLN